MSEDKTTMKEVFQDILFCLERGNALLFSQYLNTFLQYMYMDNLLTLNTVLGLRDTLQLEWKYMERNPDGTVSCFKDDAILDVFEPTKLAVYLVREILKDEQLASILLTRDYDGFLELLQKSGWSEKNRRICENTLMVRNLIYMGDKVYFLEDGAIYSLPQLGFQIAYRVKRTPIYSGVKHLLFGDKEYHRIYASLDKGEGYICFYVKEDKVRIVKDAIFLGVDTEGKEWLYSVKKETIYVYYMGRYIAEKLINENEKKRSISKQNLWKTYLDNIIGEVKPGEINRAICLQELYTCPSPFSMKEIKKKLEVYKETESKLEVTDKWMEELRAKGVNTESDISDLLYEKIKNVSGKDLTITLNYGII